MKNRRFAFLLALIIAGMGSQTSAQKYAGKMGVEAGGDAFVDVVKTSYRWAKPDGSGGWVDLKAGDADTSGWPTSDCRWVIDNRPCAEWFGQIDDPDAYRIDRSGTYRGSFKGQAVLTKIEGPFTLSNQVYTAASNTTTFDLTIGAPGPHHGLIVMSFTNTKRTSTSATGTGITEFRLLRPGYPAGTTQVFTDEYLGCLTSAAFSTIRFMGVTNTNGNVEWTATGTTTQSWSIRKKITDASIGTLDPLNKKDGWPWEYVIDLCNAANMDMWINIPVSVDDDYIRQLATLIKNNLKTSLNIYIEHSNEIWNWGFIQYAWNSARASEEMHAGTGNYGADSTLWGQHRHAKRVRDAVTIFGSVLGTDQINKRIRGVLAGVTPDPQGFFINGRLAGMLDYLNSTYGAPKNYIYAISVPLYYGGSAASGSDTSKTFTVDQIIDSMQAGSDAGRSDRTKMIQLATTYQLPGGYCSYEGGPDIGGGSTHDVGNRIRAVRAARQKDVYKRNFADNFWDLGGNLAMQFTLEGAYSRYGSWGLTDDVNNPDRNYLFAAVRELIGAGSPVGVAPRSESKAFAANSFSIRRTALVDASTPSISVQAGQSGSVRLNVFDVSGHLVMSTIAPVHAGVNSVRISLLQRSTSVCAIRTEPLSFTR
jgi:hypothetical protein